MLDYSRNSRHILVTAGDDGSVHLWDTTARTPKVPILHASFIGGTCCSSVHLKTRVMLFLYR